MKQNTKVYSNQNRTAHMLSLAAIRHIETFEADLIEIYLLLQFLLNPFANVRVGSKKQK